MSVLRIKEVLKEKGISGKELSVRVNVSQPAVSDIVNGKSFPRPELLLEIASALDVDIRDLFISSKESKKETQLYLKNDNNEFVKYGKIVLE